MPCLVHLDPSFNTLHEPKEHGEANGKPEREPLDAFPPIVP